MRIMSVDDIRSIRQEIKEVFEIYNVDFVEAENGISAFKVLEKFNGKIDLIILDWQMPEMNGYEFLLSIKENEKYLHIPVIMMTTYGSKEYILKAKNAGAVEYIIKPFLSEELIAKTVDILGIDNFKLL